MEEPMRHPPPMEPLQMCHLSHHSRTALQVNQLLHRRPMGLPVRHKLRPHRMELPVSLRPNRMAHQVSLHPVNPHPRHHTVPPVSLRHHLHMELRVQQLHPRLMAHLLPQHPLLRMVLQVHHSARLPLRTELPVPVRQHHHMEPLPVSHHHPMAHHLSRHMALLVNHSPMPVLECLLLLPELHPRRMVRLHQCPTHMERLLLTRTHIPATHSPFHPTRLDRHQHWKTYPKSISLTMGPGTRITRPLRFSIFLTT